MRVLVASASLLVGGVATADDLRGIDRLLCTAGEIVVCVEGDECHSVPAIEADVPDFLIVDVAKKQVSTTKASQRNRVTAIASSSRAEGRIYLQGVDLGRAFSFLIDEETGRVTVAVSRDGATVTVFGACTDANVK